MYRERPATEMTEQQHPSSEQVSGPSAGVFAERRPAGSEGERLRRLLDVGQALTTELDQETVLDRVLQTARELTGARYAALGILDERRTRLASFLTLGVDDRTRRAIGELPHGRGVLGVLIDHPRALRLADVGEHPSSYGFPAGHPG